jgi:uncharacterized protein
VKQAIQLAFRLYKRWISPALPHSCRFVPTCSEYAMEAVERYGAVRGSVMATKRVLRCHPLARAGYDAVPQVDRAVRSAPPLSVTSGSGSEVRPQNPNQQYRLR